MADMVYVTQVRTVVLPGEGASAVGFLVRCASWRGRTLVKGGAAELCPSWLAGWCVLVAPFSLLLSMWARQGLRESAVWGSTGRSTRHSVCLPRGWLPTGAWAHEGIRNWQEALLATLSLPVSAGQ